MKILITGASRGIGRAIALEFGKSGFHTLFLTYNKTFKDNMIDLKEELEEMCNEVMLLRMDVSDRHQVSRQAIRLIEEGIKLDAIINNAGIRKDKTLAKMSDEDWDEVINVNLTGAFNVTKAFLPCLVSGSSIINIGSIIGLTGNFGQTNYAASKAGLLALTKSLAKELSSKNVRVNMVSPSLVDTGIFDDLTVEQKNKLIERSAFKRMASAEEIAKFVKFLVVDGTYCTGQNYIVDGGFT